jgi:oligopeptide transport system ATP-binding protein
MGKVIVSIKDLNVKFMSHGTVNSVIKNISLDIYENETLAIVGESGSGKSVLTRTFTNIIERNGFITNGSINYYGKMPNLIGAHDEQIDLTTYHYHLMDGISRSKVIKLYKKEIKEINDLLLKDTINEDAALLKEKIQQLQQEMDKFINSKPS